MRSGESSSESSVPSRSMACEPWRRAEKVWALMGAWRGADLVVLIDTVHSGGKPGAIYRIEAHVEEIPRSFFHYSTHALSVAEAVELARALGQLPPRLVIYGIEGKNFESDISLSPEIQTAAEEAAPRVRVELCTSSYSSSTRSGKITAIAREQGPSRIASVKGSLLCRPTSPLSTLSRSRSARPPRELG